jgi:2-amino-4-hydroxy-6-hydroxymethyldihydropteridine diphosphokinase
MLYGSRTGTAATDVALHTVWLGLGSNLGDRGRHLARALNALQGLLTIDAVSPVYETEPVGYLEQPPFWNLVVRGSTEYEPEALLSAVKRLEQELGRVATFHLGPRVIDIDILLFGEQVLGTGELQLPHPGMSQRAFVLRPLLDIDARVTDPVTGERLADLPAASQQVGLRRLGAAADVLPTSE